MNPDVKAIVYLKTKVICDFIYPRKIFAFRYPPSSQHRPRARDIPANIFNVLMALVDRLGFTGPTRVVERNQKAD